MADISQYRKEGFLAIAGEAPADMDPGGRSAWTGAALILAALALAGITYVILIPNAPFLTLDSSSYMRLANDIRNLQLSELHLRTPGFPLLLIATGSVSTPTRMLFYACLALHFVAVGLIVSLLWTLGINRWVTGTVLAASLMPPFVAPCAYVMPETLAEFTAVLSVMLLLWWAGTGRTSWAVLFALLLPLVGAVRPTYELVAVPLALATLLCVLLRVTRVSARRVVLTMGAAFLLCAGYQSLWAAQNYRRFGYFGTTRIVPLSLSTKSSDVVEYIGDEDQALREILVKYRDQNLVEPYRDHTGKDYIFRALPEITDHFGGNPAVTAQRLKKVFVKLILNKPMSYLNMSMKAFAQFWMPNDDPIYSNGSVAWRAVWDGLQACLIALYFLQVVIVGGAGVWALSFRRTREMVSRALAGDQARGIVVFYVLGNVLIVYTAVVSSLFGTGEPRYRQPVELLLMAVTAVGFTLWRRSGVIAGDGYQYRH